MQPVHRADNLASFMFQLSRNPGTLNPMKPKGSVQACRDSFTFTLPLPVHARCSPVSSQYWHCLLWNCFIAKLYWNCWYV